MRTKLKKGVDPFSCKKSENFFHVHSALLSQPLGTVHADAFRLAAELALDWQLSGKKPHNDFLLFPVLYNYRHAIELTLKEFIILGLRTKFFTAAEAKAFRARAGVLGEHDLQ